MHGVEMKKPKNIMTSEEYRVLMAKKSVKKKPKQKQKRQKTKATIIPMHTWEAFFLPVPIPEFEFSNRKFRFDYAFPNVKLAVEIEGGAYARTIKCHSCGQVVKVKSKKGGLVPFRFGGGHNGSRFESDREKYNLAIELGWVVLRYKPQAIDYCQIKTVYENLGGFI